MPAPSTDRKMEYVTSGRNEKIKGGIQRFKLGLHGGNLPVAAMIGYIQEKSISHWHQLINQWISDLAAGRVSDLCSWKVAEQLGRLERDAAKGIAASKSMHDRPEHPEKMPIELRHLWVEMTTPGSGE